MYKPEEINNFIKTAKDFDTNLISDGYHTFGELYEHRIALFIALSNTLQKYHDKQIVWKSKKHSDGTSWEGWFIAGIYHSKGKQISYHLPIKDWDKLNCPEINNAPEWDGHTPNDVVDRLEKLK